MAPLLPKGLSMVQQKCRLTSSGWKTVAYTARLVTAAACASASAASEMPYVSADCFRRATRRSCCASCLRVTTLRSGTGVGSGGVELGVRGSSARHTRQCTHRQQAPLSELRGDEEIRCHRRLHAPRRAFTASLPSHNPPQLPTHPSGSSSAWGSTCVSCCSRCATSASSRPTSTSLVPRGSAFSSSSSALS